MPLWYPTLYCTTQRRNASKAASTLLADVQHIRDVLDWFDEQGLDLCARIRSGCLDVLTPPEIESLVDALGRRRTPQVCRSKVVPLRRRKPARGTGKQVEPGVKYNRISVAASYLQWYINRYAYDHGFGSQELQASVHSIAAHLRLLRPTRSSFHRLGLRQGLSEEAQACLLALIEPGSQKNPFEPDLQRRNALVVKLLLDLGIRLGELLTLKVTDFDFRNNEVVIPRRADDPTDPRRRQPVTKTFDRRLPMSEALAAEVFEYTKVRRSFVRTRKHAFLIVVHAEGEFQGQPITQKGIDKVFAALRAAEPKRLHDLSAHILRHTSNDRFSEYMDEAGIKPGDEERRREYKYGWKYGSGTAATYTKRHIEREAQKASLKLQKQFRKEGQKEKGN
ncbi:MAG: tyrosine-type recombinase/integrase [Chthoniobacter sp.]